MSEATNIYSNLSSQTKFRLNELTIKKNDEYNVSKYTTAFDYFDKTLIVLPATSGGITIISFQVLLEFI